MQPHDPEAAPKDLGQHRQALADIASQWDQAEIDIKIAEQACGDEVVVPSINELRYAGRRVVDALNEISGDGDDEKISGYLSDARFFCHRARHDAIDAAFSTIAQTLNAMVDRLGHSAVKSAYPEFTVFWRRFQAARRLIVDARGKRANREDIYSELENSEFRTLTDEFQYIVSEESIMKKYKARQSVILISAVGGAAASIVAIILMLVFKVLAN